jgi:hypothetical protein
LISVAILDWISEACEWVLVEIVDSILGRELMDFKEVEILATGCVPLEEEAVLILNWTLSVHVHLCIINN